jgi:hypothetical protein
MANLRDLIFNATTIGDEGDNPDSLNLKEQAHRRKDLENERYASDTIDRKWLAEWSAIVVSLWLFFVLIIVAYNKEHFNLSDSVLNVLLGTTTLNILGLMYIVLRGHFYAPKQEK